MKQAKTYDAGILFFDIRNFSSHRLFLASQKRATRLTRFVQSLLNEAVKLSAACQKESNNDEDPWMNHTGDGFLLIMRGGSGPLSALMFASRFRRFVDALTHKYNLRFKENFPDSKLEPLAWGMGLNAGWAVPFEYIGFSGQKRKGFIGSALNLASRVEACTKDHVCPMICTKRVRDSILATLTTRNRESDAPFFSLGEHKIRGHPNPVVLFGVEEEMDRYLQGEKML